MPEDVDINEQEITVDEEQLLDAKETEGEKPQKEESSTSGQEEGQEEKSSEDDSTRTDTSLKTEEKEESGEGEKKEVEENEEDTRFDKHPRFQKIIQERNDAVEKLNALKDFQDVMQGSDVSELKKIREASALLKKYPELATKVQKVIDEHQYGNEEVNAKFGELTNKITELETKQVVNDIVKETNNLISSAKLSEKEEPIFREILGARIAQLKINTSNDMPIIKKMFDKTLKDIENFRRTSIASHIETKTHETKVPASAITKGKVTVTKKESAELEDVVGELTEGLKSMRSGTEKE